MEFEHVLQLIEAVSRSELTQFKYEGEDVRLHLKKEKDQIRVVTAEPAVLPREIPVPAAAEKTELPGTKTGTEEGKVVKSPLVGVFYAAPAEDAAPFVQIGDTVKKGQTLAIVEAMKLMNEIESEFDGTVTEILAENGQPVEYGQPLFRIS